MKERERRQVNLRLPEDVIEQLDALRRASLTSRAAVIARLVREAARQEIPEEKPKGPRVRS